jgi:hypothetical protein
MRAWRWLPVALLAIALGFGAWWVGDEKAQRGPPLSPYGADLSMCSYLQEIKTLQAAATYEAAREEWEGHARANDEVYQRYAASSARRSGHDGRPVAGEEDTFMRWARDHGRPFERPGDAGSVQISGLTEELGPIIANNDEAVLREFCRQAGGSL